MSDPRGEKCKVLRQSSGRSTDDGCLHLLPEKYPNLAYAREPVPSVAGELAEVRDSTTRRAGAAWGSDAAITDLAQRFHMTLADMKKHVSVLEQAGLVITEKSDAYEPAGSDRASLKKRPPGSSGTVNPGAHASTRWADLSST